MTSIKISFALVLALSALNVSTYAAGPVIPPHQEPAEEIRDLEAQKKAAVESLNRYNPFSPDYGKAKDAHAYNIPIPPNSPYASIEKFLSNRGVQAFLRFFSSPGFAQGIEQILNSPNRLYVLYAEAAWFLALILFRAWRLSRLSSSNWVKILWLNLWTFAVYIVGCTAIIPWVFLGDPYYHVLKGIIEVVRR